jgi:hypothetical protein
LIHLSFYESNLLPQGDCFVSRMLLEPFTRFGIYASNLGGNGVVCRMGEKELLAELIYAFGGNPYSVLINARTRITGLYSFYLHCRPPWRNLPSKLSRKSDRTLLPHYFSCKTASQHKASKGGFQIATNSKVAEAFPSPGNIETYGFSYTYFQVESTVKGLVNDPCQNLNFDFEHMVLNPAIITGSQ